MDRITTPLCRRSFLGGCAAALQGGAAETGRAMRQLTTGRANSYPLYYFTPSITSDGRYLVFHSERTGWVQLYRMDLASGATVPLSEGRTRDSGWAIWCERHLRGVYNHLAALNTATREVLYFQDEEIRGTQLDTLAGRLVARIPGRFPIGQTSCSPDGRLFAFIHAGREHFERAISDREALTNMGQFGWSQGHQEWRNQVPCVISVLELSSGKLRTVIELDFHVHHVIFANNRTLIVNHPQNDSGMWMIHVDGTGRRALRPRDEHGAIVHQVVTDRGIFYEAVSRRDNRAVNWLGCYDLERHTHEEVELAGMEGYVHTGWDPAGKFLFFEHHGQTHELVSLHFPFQPARRRLNRLRSMALYPRPGQRYHAHPFLSPDRKSLIYTEVVEGFAQVCALDVADLVDRDEYWDARAGA